MAERDACALADHTASCLDASGATSCALRAPTCEFAHPMRVFDNGRRRDRIKTEAVATNRG